MAVGPLTWDGVGEKRYETGVDHAVIYLFNNATKKYDNGVAWNGITKVSDSPEGAEAQESYADNILYASILSAEKYNGTIEAFQYPDEFAQCDGTAEIAPGILIGQQERKPFGFSYRTRIGNDAAGSEMGYKLHLVYGAKAKPSSQDHETVNDSPELAAFSWEISTTPVPVKGHKPTSTLTIDSTKVDAAKLKKLEDKLYGTETTAPSLPLPDEVAELVK